MPKSKFGYIDREFFEGLTGVYLEESGFETGFDDAVFTASETINAGCGNNIDRVGIDNLSEPQQRAVKKATALLVKHYLTTFKTDNILLLFPSEFHKLSGPLTLYTPNISITLC